MEQDLSDSDSDSDGSNDDAGRVCPALCDKPPVPQPPQPPLPPQPRPQPPPPVMSASPGMLMFYAYGWTNGPAPDELDMGLDPVSTVPIYSANPAAPPAPANAGPGPADIALAELGFCDPPPLRLRRLRAAAEERDPELATALASLTNLDAFKALTGWQPAPLPGWAPPEGCRAPLETSLPRQNLIWVFGRATPSAATPWPTSCVQL